MMEEIKDLAEGGAFMDAVDDIMGLNLPLRDAEIARLRKAWIAGRDYAQDRAASAERRVAELEAALRRASMMNDNGYTRCRGCGVRWHTGDTEVHAPKCWIQEALARPAEGAGREGQS